MVERLLEDPEDVLYFDDKTLVSNYRLLRNILQLAQELQPALQRPTKGSRSIVQVTNALCFFLQKAIFKVKQLLFTSSAVLVAW